MKAKKNVMKDAGSPSVSPPSSKGFEKYEIDSWTRTICEAMEILNDPKKMKAVKGEMEKKKKAITSFDDLKLQIAEGDKES